VTQWQQKNLKSHLWHKELLKFWIKWHLLCIWIYWLHSINIFLPTSEHRAANVSWKSIYKKNLSFKSIQSHIVHWNLSVSICTSIYPPTCTDCIMQPV